ncbi:MAG TPA: oligosaccharide flippase family protein [bacterium]|nr:oligosaccharide flippase family protein [bacterium]
MEESGENLGTAAASAPRGEMLRNIAETFGTRALLLGVNFAVSVATARMLLEEGRGLLAVAMFIGSVGIQLSGLGLHTSSVYFPARDRTLIGPVLANAMAVCLAAGLISAAGAAAVARLQPDLFSIDGSLLFLALLYIPVGQTITVTSNMLLGMKDVRAFNISTIGPPVILLALLCAAYFTGGATPVSALAMAIVSMIPLAAWGTARIARQASGRPEFSPALLKDMFSYGARAYAAAFPAFLVFRVDIILIFKYLGAAEAGIYSISVALAGLLRILPQVAGQIVHPKLCGMDSWDEKLALTKKTALGITAATLPAIAAAALLAKPLIVLFYGKAFATAAVPFLLTLPGIFAWNLQSVVGKILISDGYSGKIVVAWFAALAVNLGLNIALIPKIGLPGAAIAFSAALIALSAAILFIIFSTDRKMKRAGAPRASGGGAA